MQYVRDVLPTRVSSSIDYSIAYVSSVLGIASSSAGYKESMYVALLVLVAVTLTIGLQVLVSTVLEKKKQISKGVKATVNEGFHFARRTQHAATGLLFYALSYTDLGRKYRTEAIATLFACAVGVYLVHLLRLRNRKVHNFLAKLYKSILREREVQGGVPGAFYFLLGLSLSGMAVQYAETVAGDTNAMEAFRLGILFLSLGDPAAALVGTWVSRKYSKQGKTVAGSVACFLTCCACAWWETGGDLRKTAVTGMAGALSERFSVLDDNLSIPIVSTGVVLFMNNYQRYQQLQNAFWFMPKMEL